jgi:hypothetical protein
MKGVCVQGLIKTLPSQDNSLNFNILPGLLRIKVKLVTGRVVAQAVSRWPLIAGAWNRAQVSPCEMRGTGTVFLGFFSFPCQ